jgi:molecular chaperone GrpE
VSTSSDETSEVVDVDVGDEALEEAAAAVEHDIDVAQVLAERDDYLDALRRVQADFENFKKQNIRRNTELVERAAEGLVVKLLPVLDAFDGALAHGADDAKPIYDLLMDALEKEGLTLLYPMGEAFDPARMEAVAHEAADDTTESLVSEVLRSGYLWKGRVLRPAMVKVKG